uniref:nucleotidyltransferase family protein n=1 Tax=Candidatus Electrothrix sp. TaxID=2170559 RepID=UPI0040559E88
MLKQNDILAFLSKQLPELQAEYNISKIGLFGSFARNEQDENSDIDIVLEFHPGTENIYEKKTSLKKIFKNYFHREIDLCRLKYVKPFIKDYLEKEVIYV